jgi:hypothetical protein
MTRRIALLAFVSALVASCAEKPVRAPAPVATLAPQASAVPVAAPSQSCVGLTQIRESIVRSDKVIDFKMIDGRTLRNRLPYACPQLGFERAFTYATSLSQLCSVDIITVIIQGGGPMRGASCGLGQFTPISPEAAKAPLAPADR